MNVTSPDENITKVGRRRPAQSRCSVSMKEPQILAIIFKYVSYKTFIVVNCESKCGQHGMCCNITNFVQLTRNGDKSNSRNIIHSD